MLQQIEDEYTSAPLPPRWTAMLRYAEKLTRAPAEMVEGDVAALREVGFADADILAIAEVAAYYAFANRIADGLGVSLEPGEPDDAR